MAFAALDPRSVPGAELRDAAQRKAIAEPAGSTPHGAEPHEGEGAAPPQRCEALRGLWDAEERERGAEQMSSTEALNRCAQHAGQVRVRYAEELLPVAGSAPEQCDSGQDPGGGCARRTLMMREAARAATKVITLTARVCDMP